MFNIAGVISVIVFYILILAIGIWASRKQSSAKDVDKEVKTVTNFHVKNDFSVINLYHKDLV